MTDNPFAAYDEYSVNENEFKPKLPPLKQSTDQFPQAELVQRVLNDEDFENDSYEYVRIILLNDPQIFENQIKILSNTPIHIAISQFEAFEYKNHQSVIFRYYPNGSLQHLFTQIKNGENIAYFDDTMKSILIFGVVSAVTHLHNLFDYSEDDYKRFCSQLSSSFSKGVLDLSGQRIGINMLTKLTKVLRQAPHIRVFNLYGNLVRDHGIHSLLQLLLANQQVEVLDIGCNDLSNQAVPCLIDIIKETKIKSLQIGTTGLAWHNNKIFNE